MSYSLFFFADCCVMLLLVGLRLLHELVGLGDGEMFPCGQEHAAQCSVQAFHYFIVFSFYFHSLSVNMVGTFCVITFKMSLFF